MLLDQNLSTDSATVRSLRQFYREREDRVLQHLLPIADISSAARSRAWERARQLVIEIRRRQVGKGGVDALLNEFALSTEEGVVLMCLAEALLRIPDSLTMDRLIRDKLASGDWSAHLGNSDSLFVNASAWGLLLTGKVVTYNDEHSTEQFGLLKKTMGRVGEPVIRASVRYAMQIMGTQFVMGTSINSAVQRAREEEARGYRYSYDMLGEGARTMADADRYFESYMNAIEAIGEAAAGRGPYDSPGISVKLSAIHPRYEFSHRKRVMRELVPRLQQLAEAARRHNIGFTVDAEEADRLELSLDVIEQVFSSAALEGWDGFGIAIQAYQKRSIWVIEWLREITQKLGRRMMVRLVKGAYWDTEIKLSQVEGFTDFPVFTRKAATDVSYQACARKLLEYRDTLYPQFATHNAYTVATVLEMDETRTGYEFQRLHGMGDALYDQVVQGESVPCRIYAPVGIHADLLAYLVRRLLENGANSSFVNNIVDENTPVESLLEDPVELARSWTTPSNEHIASPPALYGAERPNAAGFDLTDYLALEQARTVMQSTLNALPLNFSSQKPALEIRNPADHNELVGTVDLHDGNTMAIALQRASAAFSTWQSTDVKERARLLFALADALEVHRDELIVLCCKEAGKTIPDSVAEIREAVDFCRYYALQSLEQKFDEQGLRPRGVILCISPWNFPLAIFLGQIAAALAVGNTVIAKPAEQTSLIALRTRDIMLSCGFPEDVVVPVVARGPEVGHHLVPDNRIKAAIFTGSTETGAVIARTLAQRVDAPVPLIAETGGQNCMLVDSTALPEQVVDDVITSGFQSAGQRCSALRVLFLQEDIADKVIDMIIGAMRELTIGDPALLSTDIGPVIDAQALARLEAHTKFMSNSGRLLYQCDAPSDSEHTFFAPRLYEISNLSLLEREVFGPVVHVIRYRADALEEIIDQVNATGYGLTFGIHSRIEDITGHVAERIQAGNIYINRNMIGAIVGVQPFGGRGLSGTGPKAGGPHYLGRLVTTGEEAENADGQVALPAAGNSVALELFQHASTAQKTWNKRSLNDRLSTLRQFIARYSQRPADEHTAILEETLAAARSQLLYARDVLEQPLELPGPTGESNYLLLEARGQLLLILDNREYSGEYLLAMLSALAAGNVVTALADRELLEEWQGIVSALNASGLSEHCVSVTSMEAAPEALASRHVNGAMVHAQSPYLHDVASVLAKREGALVPLVTCVSPHALLRQTLLEKTVSIDTTAAGGNASLMTMAS